MAITRGLEIVRNLQISKLEVQMDNLACVQVLHKQEVQRGENIHDIIYCRNMLNDSRWEVNVAHVYREGNRAADWFANREIIQDSQLVFFNNIPIELSRILEEDTRGVALPCFVPP
ncbi:uncharacterized protein LOC110716382 [Chenopodium quinoa]|uniref:uncharacterized protein LOC110716382 n=1 Tax=Chenopodium quinoa TaxID=63459 RepID=UPI000B78F078|nr:uncharacterized protein LOC110716382 [Chenopodium quinoa]